MIPLSASIQNENGTNTIELITGDSSHSIDIPTQKNVLGSRARGGELLFLALAVCYTNDIYREAANLQIDVESVEVKVNGDFSGDPGCVAENVTYHVKVSAKANEKTILDLIKHTDTVAEVHNTIRIPTPVTLGSSNAIGVSGADNLSSK